MCGMNKPDAAVLFDMDGVLLNSNKLAADSFDAVLGPYGIAMADVKDRFGEGYKGGSLRDFLFAVKEQYGHNFDLQDFSKQAGDLFFVEMEKSHIKADDSLIKLLDDLCEHDVKLAVGTSSMRWRAIKILDLLGLSKYFEAVVTADEVAEHKPNPHIYLEAAKRLNVATKKCVVIEDAESGVEAARRARMKVIGFAKYNVPETALQKADMVVRDWPELTLERISALTQTG
jgi:beta-phosphoglucomutase